MPLAQPRTCIPVLQRHNCLEVSRIWPLLQSFCVCGAIWVTIHVWVTGPYHRGSDGLGHVAYVHMPFTTGSSLGTS